MNNIGSLNIQSNKIVIFKADDLTRGEKLQYRLLSSLLGVNLKGFQLTDVPPLSSGHHLEGYGQTEVLIPMKIILLEMMGTT